MSALAVEMAKPLPAVVFELEGQRPRPLLPTFRTGQGRKALTAPGLAQLDGVANEPGVRETT